MAYALTDELKASLKRMARDLRERGLQPPFYVVARYEFDVKVLRTDYGKLRFKKMANAPSDMLYVMDRQGYMQLKRKGA